MRSLLYDVDDLLTGARYRQIPSSRVMEILKGHTKKRSAGDFFRDSRNTCVVDRRFALTAYRSTDDSTQLRSLWRMYPDWCRWFIKEWAKACESVRRRAMKEVVG